MTHWTNNSVDDFVSRIGFDFVTQLEKKMESLSISRGELATRLGVSSGRVSQIFNNPRNMTLRTIIKCARILGMKVSVVAYDDGDPLNENGPIDSEIFARCWEESGKPKDFYCIEQTLV